jgi:hypothetical protein
VEDDEIQQKVEQLKRDLSESNALSVGGNVLFQSVLILRTSIWARSEEPRRMADLTGIPVSEVEEIAEGFKKMGIWPLAVEQ